MSTETNPEGRDVAPPAVRALPSAREPADSRRPAAEPIGGAFPRGSSVRVRRTGETGVIAWPQFGDRFAFFDGNLRVYYVLVDGTDELRQFLSSGLDLVLD